MSAAEAGNAQPPRPPGISGNSQAAGIELTPRQKRQIGGITIAAFATFALLRWLPTGTNLSHMDFRVDAKNSIDFCDPLNPQFIPVVAVASPVTMTLAAGQALAGKPVTAAVMLRTASGKPVASEDLLVVHTQRLHLLIIDPSLTDYQHVHPTPTGKPGEWGFQFIPQHTGTYRIFADFTPAATNRGLYSNTELTVSPGSTAAVGRSEADATEGGRAPTQMIERDGFHFELTPGAPIRARQPADLKFTVRRLDGAAVPLQPVMDAYAHLVAFDEGRMGFAHLHPTDPDLTHKPDTTHPALDFKITIPSAGRYVIWAQVNLAGRETFVPFWFDVAP